MPAAAVGVQDGPQDSSVAAIVGGIISYSRWPQPPSTVRLCVAGATQHAGRVAQADASATHNITIVRTSGTATALACDVLYLGETSVAARRHLLDLARRRPVLTIVENDPACRSGAMVCLLTDRIPASFRLNLDAIARSPVRVDPRVLRIAGGAP